MSKSTLTEHAIQNQIRHYLEWTGARVERLNSGAVRAEYGGRTRFVRFTFPGCPDLVALLKDGRTLWIECKKPGGKLSGPQAKFKDDCVRRGVPHLVATSVEDVRRYLNKEGDV